MSQLYWTKNKHVLNFASGATSPTEGAIKLEGAAAVSLIFGSDFNGDTITLKSTIAGDTGFTITGATGRVTPNSDQQMAIATMPDLLVTTGTATGAAAQIVVCTVGG